MTWNKGAPIDNDWYLTYTFDGEYAVLYWMDNWYVTDNPDGDEIMIEGVVAWQELPAKPID